MPYITDQKKWELQNRYAENPGELNYQITRLLVRYRNTKGLSYQTINDVLGALEGAKAEFYRRVAAPYENIKISTNGDVYAASSEEAFTAYPKTGREVG